MKRKLFLLTMLMILGASGCDKKQDESTAPTVEQTKVEADKAESKEDTISLATIESDQALAAVRNYCIKRQPELADMANSEDYTLYWEVESYNADQIVVLYRSYTGAQVRYYVDNKTGDVYVTEFVPGITEEEERTEETFNVKDYMDDSGVSDIGNVTAGASVLTGTWQSASMVEEDGAAQSEFYVQFTDKAINYGHLKDDEFVTDYSDEIVSFEELDNRGYRVLAKNSNGVQYTYQTCETDANIMEYYGTWDEAEFADAYSGSASIFRQ